MRKTRFSAAVSGLTGFILCAAPGAFAATPTAAPPPPAVVAPTSAVSAPAAPPPNGPAVAGVCLLSQEALIGRSRVGLAATQRLRDLAGQAQSSLAAEKTRLEARGRALEAKRATLTPLQLQAQGQAINQAAQALQARAGERSAQIEATKSKAYNAVILQAQPLIAQAYTAHACGLLLARETVLTGNMTNDLTGEIVAALDAKATPITFDLEPPRATK